LRLHTARDLTGGPNGTADVDAFRVFGHHLTTNRAYFWASLIAVAVVFVAVHFMNQSRTGRAWRALRDDPLATELMGMPVNRLKLLAIARSEERRVGKGWRGW